jgi:hypothetical protein
LAFCHDYDDDDDDDDDDNNNNRNSDNIDLLLSVWKIFGKITKRATKGNYIAKF